MDHVDLNTGELVSETSAELLRLVNALSVERDDLARSLAQHQAAQAQLAADAAAARREVATLRTKLATAACPEGRLRVRGRIVNLPTGGLAVVADGGRVVRLVQAPGNDLGIPDGEAIVVEALLDARRGWMLWRAKPLAAEDALAVAVVPAELHAGLTALRAPTHPSEKLTAVDQLDKDEAGTADLRRHSHHASAISLHIVLVRHRRGIGVPLTDDQACDLKADVADVVERMLGWRVLACNTGSLDERHRHDHLHLAVGHIDATKPIGGAIGRIKATSSRRMRERHPELAQHDHFWSAGWFASSFGGPNESQVRAYIAAQAQ